jgi:hypothetical protein
MRFRTSRHHNASAPLGCSDCARARNSQITHCPKSGIRRTDCGATWSSHHSRRTHPPPAPRVRRRSRPPGRLRLAATRFRGPCRAPIALREVSSEARRSKAGRCRRSSCSKVEDTSLGLWSRPDSGTPERFLLHMSGRLEVIFAPMALKRGLYGWSRLTKRPVFGGPGLLRRSSERQRVTGR